MNSSDIKLLSGLLDEFQLSELTRAISKGDTRDEALVRMRRAGIVNEETLRRALLVRARLEVIPDVVAEQQYLTVHPIGQGAVGVVYLAIDPSLRRKVAYKVISKVHETNDVIRNRFLVEARLTAQLDHPSIVPVYGVREEGRKVSYAMKLVDGDTLHMRLLCRRKEVLEKRAKQADVEREFIDIFLKICDAVAYAHSRGVLHRDLKPENIMVGPFGEVYVMDWGLAHLIGSEEARCDVSSVEEPWMTQEGNAVGTPTYMSPEQARGENSLLSVRSDVYALGLLLQEVTTLGAAVDGDDVNAILRRVANAGRNAPILLSGRTVRRTLVAVLKRACALEPEDRYASVAELAEDVRRYRNFEAVEAQPEGVARRVWRGLLSHRQEVLTLGLTMGMLGGLAFSFALLVMFEADRRARAREEALGDLLATVGETAHTIDRELLRYETVLSGIAASAEALLADSFEDENAVLFSPGRFEQGEVPGLINSSRYHREVSFDVPTVKFANTATAAANSDALKLVRLRHQLISWMGSEEKAKEAGVGWMYVGTASGVHITYPGHSGLPDDYDPRQRPWYQMVTPEKTKGDTSRLHWGHPYRDASGLDLILPLSTPLHNHSGDFLGVAGLDVTFDFLTNEVLLPPGLNVREAFLLNENGEIVVRSGDWHDRHANVNDELVLVSHHVQEVVIGAKSREPGHAVLKDGTLVVWFRLHALDWTYVIEGEYDSLVGKK